MLYEEQENHKNRLLEIYKINKIALDTSPTGAGKTYTSVCLAKDLGLPIFIVANKILHDKWKEVAEIFGVEIVGMINYQSLRGKTGCKLNHDYLIREGNSFKVTDILLDILNRGVLFIFDEVQAAKNSKTAQYLACRAIIIAIVDSNSKGLLLSATHGDKMIHSETTCAMLGLYKSEKLYKEIEGHNPHLYRKLGKSIELTGYLELLRFTENLVSKKIDLYPNNAKNVIQFTSTIYICYLKHLLTSEMPMPEHYTKYRKVQNTFFEVDGDTKDKVIHALNELKSAIRKEDDDREPINYAKVNEAIHLMQISKCPIVVREAKQLLIDDPNCKICVFANYNDVLETIAGELEEYGVCILNGDVKEKNRNNIIKLFIEDSSTCRVIVTNTLVGGVGVDLDDKFGHRPRHVYIMPDYKFTGLTQALGRCCRQSTKSVMFAQFVYCKDCEGEKIILDNLRTKGQVLTDLTISDKTWLIPV